MENEKTHVIPYRVYVYILLALVSFTFMSIGITSINLGAYSVLGALIFALLKSFLVLTYFMHLKFDSFFLKAAVTSVFILLLVVIVITFLDYSNR
ncbi:MAG: cytochrome C oxidase subunit IV family protein [Methylococcaceae bacterium]|nr:cytochrome C oxidase subunit IV family protein [Prolixibacteraceae bacterium]